VAGEDVREAIRELVTGIRPLDGLEASDQAGTLEWITSGAQLFRTVPPDTPSKHLVSYFVPVDTENRCLLLGDHRKSGLCLPPGGHCEDGEDPRDTVTREAAAELRPDPGEYNGVRRFGFDEKRDWPGDVYDPQMHRFARKLTAVLGL
jgi:8-oxo-dGTP diphosphatase